MIHDIEELCMSVGYTLGGEDCAQKKIEEILDYLLELGVIDKFSENKLDWIFSEECTY